MLKITVDKMKVEKVLNGLKNDVQKVVLEGASEGVRSSLKKHFFNRQKQPRKDGFPQQGFWYGNNGQSVAEKIQPTRFAKDTATISIQSAPLAHKLNPNPPPIKPGAGRKYLTLPANPAAASHPATDFSNLIFSYINKDGSPTKKGEKGFPVLSDKSTNAVYYFLARQVKTPHDPNALPTPQSLISSASESATVSISRYLSTLK